MRVRGVAARAAIWGGRAALAIAAWCCVFAWARWRAMRSVVSLASARMSTLGDEQPLAKFTVLVNTFKRPIQLEGAIRHYAACDGIDSIRVVWSEQSPPPNSATDPQYFGYPTPVQFQSHQTTSLNNRFIPPPDLATNAVFVVDDDIAVPCEHLRAAFQTWQGHQNALVGFFPRSHEYYHRHHHQQQQHQNQTEEKEDGAAGIWEYLYFWRVLWKLEYSMVLTKAAFLHREYLELYTGVLPAGQRSVVDSSIPMLKVMADVRAYVDSHRNCEDIAMQMAITSVSGTAPVATFAPVEDIGLLGGISTGEGSGKWWQAPHAVKRSGCLADLNEIFCAHTHHHAPTTRFPPSGDGVHADTKSGDADLPLDVQRRQTKQARQELQQQQQQRPPTSATCEILRRTSLFASVAALPRRRSFAVKEKERAASGGGGGGLRGAQPRQQVQGRGRGNGLDKETVDDLARISRWALAVRAPTLAEFISADMLLVPGKTWRWLTKEDVLGREI